MSRNNQTNHSFMPTHLSSYSSSDSELSSVEQNFFIFNIFFNYSSEIPPPTQEQSLLAVSNLKDVMKKKKKRRHSHRRSSSIRRSSNKSKETPHPREVDAHPIVSEQDLTDDSTQTNTKSETPKESSKRKSKSSGEYQDLSHLEKPKSKRWRISKNVRSVPVDQLPKKKFHSDSKRREYVVLGRLNSLEPIDNKEEQMTEEEKKRRSRELARELY
uniref:Uncharacterized protein n=2 Tax=Caenorhabditis tropicalis TaxID=1561998 RepID=A0A1I7TVQ6_9PELO